MWDISWLDDVVKVMDDDKNKKTLMWFRVQVYQIEGERNVYFYPDSKKEEIRLFDNING